VNRQAASPDLAELDLAYLVMPDVEVRPPYGRHDLLCAPRGAVRDHDLPPA
jgi:hypothetical protein